MMFGKCNIRYTTTNRVHGLALADSDTGTYVHVNAVHYIPSEAKPKWQSISLGVQG